SQPLCPNGRNPEAVILRAGREGAPGVLSFWWSDAQPRAGEPIMLLDPPGILQLDPLLLPYVQCPEEGAEAALASLLTVHALPVIQAILLRRSYGGLDRSDLEGEVLVRLIERLRRL